MSASPIDFRFEIIQAAPRALSAIIAGLDLPAPDASDPVFHPPAPIDITARVELDGLGTINRAMERDLLTFKTGDMTFRCINPDGFFDDLFATLGQTDHWTVKVYRRGLVQFWGVIIGQGSIDLDPVERTVEITAYGLTKVLDQTDGNLVRRILPAAGWALNGSHGPGGGGLLTLTPNASDLLTGDSLHITDHVNSEDVIIRQRVNSTQVQLEAPLANTYASGTALVLNSASHRFRDIEYLARALFGAGYVPLLDLRLNDSQFAKLAPTPVNLQSLSLANNARRGMTQYTGKWHVDIHGVDGYSQDDPTEAWITQGLPDQGVYDWTPFFTQAEQAALNPATVGLPTGEPVKIFEPVVGSTQEGVTGNRYATYWGAVDLFSSPFRIWGMSIGLVSNALIQNTTADGVTYAGTTTVTLPADAASTSDDSCVEYDPGRNIVYVTWKHNASSNRHFRYRDLGGASWVDCKQGDDSASTGYFGPRYCKELDGVLVLRCDANSSVGPFEICLFRGATRVWKRPFPGCLVQPIFFNPSFYPTRTARFVEGSIYMALVSDGAVQLLRSDDLFLSYTMRVLAPNTTNTVIMATRIGATYRVACYRGSSPKGYFICAPLFAGVIEHADFAGVSAAEGLKKLSVLANALFWTDDDLAGHFVARDLYDPGAITDIEPLLLEQTDTLIWEEAAQYVKVSGGGAEATSGDAGFASEGIDLESSFVPNEATAQAMADAYKAFYSALRRYVQVKVLDVDGRIYYPLDRVTIGDGRRYLVYESDQDLANDEVSLTLLEDL